MSYKLIIDTHEKGVSRHPEILTIPYEVLQITVGDYAMLDPRGQICAIFERKTYEDYGASLKDGRHGNREKMLELRRETGCRVIYIVEGCEFPRPNDCFSNIKYQNIESSMFHLMMRDNIMIWRTADTLDTAKFFVRFYESMCSMRAGGHVEFMGDPEHVDHATTEESVRDGVSKSTALLTAARPKTDIDILRIMWAQWPSITVDSADDYIALTSIYDIIAGRVNPTTLRLSSGKAPSKRVLRGFGGCDFTQQVRLLASIHGVSAATAKSALVAAYSICKSQRPILTLLELPMLDLANIKVGTKNIGVARAEKILTLFHMRRVVEVESEVKPHTKVEDAPHVPLISPESISAGVNEIMTLFRQVVPAEILQ